MSRICKECNIEKDLLKFHTCNNGRNYRRICGVCRTAKAKVYMNKYYNKKLEATGKTRKNKTGKIKVDEGSIS